MSSIDTRDYWDRRKAEREQDAALAARLAAVIPDADLRAELRDLQRAYAATPSRDPARDTLMERIAALSKLIDDREAERFAAEWTLETTRERRERWDAYVESGHNLTECTRDLGYSINQLHRAIALHGL